MPNESVVDAFWVGGVDSSLDPAFLKPTQFQWGINVDNSGGYLQTRHGFSKIGSLDGLYDLPEKPRGLTVFTAKGKVPAMIVAVGNKLLHSPYPFTSPFVPLPGATWRGESGPVVFVHAVKSVKRETNGSTTVISPYPVLIIQDGQGRAMVWDGTSLVESNPSKTQGTYGIPIGLWGAWSGNRYWVSNGVTVRASDLADPLTFTEEDEVAAGGFFTMPANVTGMGQTPDFKNLLIFTDGTTTSVQSSILDRAQWGNTNDFQRVILPGIGCAAGKSIINQYGLTWWYSHAGLIGLDQALQTYRSSKIMSRDAQMLRSKSNMADDISGICSGHFGNYLILSTPSGDRNNAHTWALNQSVLSSEDTGGPAEWTGVWTGIRPVEWVTCITNGAYRCFALSMDYGDGAQDYYINVWEAFTGARADVNGELAKPIQCAVETRALAMSPDFKRIEWVELECAEMQGKIDLEVFYSGVRGGYKEMLTTSLVASLGSPNGPAQVTATATASEYSTGTLTVDSTTGFESAGTVYILGQAMTYTGKTSTTFTGASDLDSFVAGSQVQQTLVEYDPLGSDSSVQQSYRPQRRTLRTPTVTNEDCSSCPVESRSTDAIDRGFSILVRWTGRMALAGIRLVYSTDKEYQVAPCQEDESGARYITEEGCGSVLNEIMQPEDSQVMTTTRRHRYLQVFTPKHIEQSYTSLL